MTRALVVAKNIGKPALRSDGTCVVDVDALVSSLSPGLYDAVVEAAASSGTTPSFPSTFSR